MRRVVVLAMLVACTGSGDGVDPTGDSDVDTTDTGDTGEELPFDFGAWVVELLEPDSDGCNLAATGEHDATLAAGGEDFLFSFDGAPIGPATFDCDLRGYTFTCEDPDARLIQGTFSSRTGSSGSFRDGSCGSVFNFIAHKP